MEEIQYPYQGYKSAHEVIQEAIKTGKPIADILGKGLPEDYTPEQLIESHIRGECSEGYLATRLKVDRLEVRRLLQHRPVKYVKMFDSPGVLEVKNIDTFEGQTVYMLEAEKGLIEPYSERLVERKFSSYSEVAHYLYGEGKALEIRRLLAEKHECIPATEDIVTDCIVCHKQIVQ